MSEALNVSMCNINMKDVERVIIQPILHVHSFMILLPSSTIIAVHMQTCNHVLLILRLNCLAKLCLLLLVIPVMCLFGAAKERTPVIL